MVDDALFIELPEFGANLDVRCDCCWSCFASKPGAGLKVLGPEGMLNGGRCDAICRLEVSESCWFS